MQKIQKEKILYESLINKASDRDFMISFHDYFSFIEKEGIGLCSHLNEPIKERNKDEGTLKNLYIEILSSVTKFIKDIELFLKKEGLEKEYPVLLDGKFQKLKKRSRLYTKIVVNLYMVLIIKK